MALFPELDNKAKIMFMLELYIGKLILCSCSEKLEPESYGEIDEIMDAIREKLTVADAIGTIVETEAGEKEKKNILKFLTSEDPALVKMGVSMLKGILKE